MADSNDSQKQLKPVTQGEPSMERRMLLAFLLMGAVLFLTPYFYKSMTPPAAKQTPAAAAKKSAEPPQPEPASVQAAPASKTAPEPVAAVAAAGETSHVVDTDLYRVVFSNRGAVARSWTLKKYKDHAGKPLELINTAAAAKIGYPFSLGFKSKKPAYDANQALYAVKPSADSLGVVFEYSDGNTSIRKTFQFQKDKYLAQLSVEAAQGGAEIPSLVMWRGGFGDHAVASASSTQHSLYYDQLAGKLTVQDSKAGAKGTVVESGDYSFAGLEDMYFVAVFLPSAAGRVEVHTLSDQVPSPVNAAEEPHVGAAIGGGTQNRFSLFVGPKDLDILRKVNPKLEQMVDWGWFGFLAQPLFVALNWLNANLVHNYGWAIILLTVVINFALLPLKFTSMKSMKRMQSLQPQIAAINAKYKDVGLRDPRKAQQNQETMDLYKKHGVNPMGGCLPMLLQIPFFIAFYKVLTVAINMRGAEWLWVADLSQPETLPIRILPVTMIVTQFIMQKMTPSTTADPTQQKMMMIMPLVFGFMFYHFSSGLVLYWLTSNVVGIAQQWFINRTTGPVAVAAPAEPAKRKRG